MGDTPKLKQLSDSSIKNEPKQENDENSSDLANNADNHHHQEAHSSFDFHPNILQFFYPKQVQRQLHKKKYSHSERIIHALRAPIKNHQGVNKHAMKLKALGEC